ncbi:SIR2 family protein [Enterococcus gallinarum]|uniref:SIR2 family protein n=4 Tax=Bacteria TaxID=2 RepID=A0AAE4HPS5_ENTGA|nr:SIR2 family protein [Enterococcus gallinarum]MDT2690251.1 SIR2 family protein [Enterococcus gallinarum]
MSEKIYIEHNNDIEFTEEYVKVNGKKISIEEKKDNETWEQVAIRLRDAALQKHLKRQYENTIILTGAGSSFGVGIGDKKGKLMSGLWEEAVNKFGYSHLKKFCEKINFKEIQPENETTNLEFLLTHAQLYQYVTGDSDIVEFIKQLRNMVKENCTLKLPKDSAHRKFLRKLAAKKTKYARPKVFTLNYDTLFEQAAEKNGFMIIDGFSFNFPRKFKGTNFDLDVVTRITNKNVLEDNFVPNVVHVYKPHGSVNWIAKNNEVIISDESEDPLMIYPSSNKYESSYQQPFFEMMSRFQQETRAKNTLLIIVGYSCGDAHINAMIYEALSVNSSITIVFVAPNIDAEDQYEDLKKEVSQTGNVILTKQTFEEFVESYPYSEIYSSAKWGSSDE